MKYDGRELAWPNCMRNILALMKSRTKGMGNIGLLNIMMSAFGITMITLFIFLWSLDEGKWSLIGISSYAIPVVLVYFVVFVYV
ncbi:hypothetical protein [Lysinibacillus fusiformis]|uniref:Uncharacterized protein n=2 Tax=Lysinibacillus fusiformis TaxID=28031 RepID=A0A1H9IUD5_9BACI|nr:hypothetical protein [Lysinibacillus fusiformis]SCY35106.1 hypothetical protein SAMN02787081_02139 [Lysinibacillus fusiformis]SEN68583.1 hypothetical protein SAMN02787103_02390 [Lysinibacillus fusiformis]SEQ78391.1 hypothetical protein SAMN02787113_02396 [Lysinibacillus fusiformis]